jgi:hypothetical protein
VLLVVDHHFSKWLPNISQVFININKNDRDTILVKSFSPSTYGPAADKTDLRTSQIIPCDVTK